MTEPAPGPDAHLTTDPPLPPGTPDVDELVGDAVPAADRGGRTEPADEDVVDDDAPAVEPPD